jgi:hypothetical protein
VEQLYQDYNLPYPSKTKFFGVDADWSHAEVTGKVLAGIKKAIIDKANGTKHSTSAQKLA